MTRSRKQKAAARNLSVAEGMSYVKSLYEGKTPFTGPFAKIMEYAYRHRSTDHEDTYQWEKDIVRCDGMSCDCDEELTPDRLMFWENTLSFLPSNMVPELVGPEVLWPHYADWELRKKYEDSPVYAPIVYATFYFPEGTGYADQLGLRKGIENALKGYKVAVTPIGEVNGHYKEQRGSISDMGFRVAVMKAETIDRFSPYEWVNTFSISELFDADLWEIKRSVPYETETITSPASPRKISKIQFAADNTMTSSDMQKIADILRDKTGVPWVSVMEGDSQEFVGVPSMDSRRVYVAYLSDHPSTTFTDIEFRFGISRQLVTRPLRLATSGEKRNRQGLPSAFSGGDIIPVGFSDCTVERDKNGIINGYKLIPSAD